MFIPLSDAEISPTWLHAHVTEMAWSKDILLYWLAERLTFDIKKELSVEVEGIDPTTFRMLDISLNRSR